MGMLYYQYLAKAEVQTMLKPQDIVILLKILSTKILSQDNYKILPQNKLATILCMSASRVHS